MKILPNGIAVLEGDTHASKWIEEHGRIEYDGAVKEDICPLLKHGDTVLDVGSLFGSYARGFKDAVGKSGKVFAFEPNPEAYECLEHNCPDILCYNMALGDTEGFCTIHPSRKYPNNAGASYVARSNHGSVQMVTLDQFWLFFDGPIRLIKVDIEGYEPEFISGAVETLKKYRPVLFIEINHDVLANRGYKWHHVIDPLTKLGYQPKFLKPEHNFREQDWPQLDLFMLP